MAHRNPTARPGREREAESGYTEGKRPIPTAGEDRYESIYRNPVGAQSGMPLEGQKSDGTDAASGAGARRAAGSRVHRLFRPYRPD